MGKNKKRKSSGSSVNLHLFGDEATLDFKTKNHLNFYGDEVTLDFKQKTYSNIHEEYRKTVQPKLLDLRMRILDALKESIPYISFFNKSFYANYINNKSAWGPPYNLVFHAERDVLMSENMKTRCVLQVSYYDEYRIRFEHTVNIILQSDQKGGSRIGSLVRRNPSIARHAEKLDGILTYTGQDNFFKRGVAEIGALHKGPMVALKIMLIQGVHNDI